MNSETEPAMNADKIDRLEHILSKKEQLAIAYSGGVDSTLLVKVALDTLGKSNVLALMAVSPLWPKEEREKAVTIAQGLGVRLLLFEAPDITQQAFAQHLSQRCYLCKSDIFSKLVPLARDNGFTHIADGTNTDDHSEIRPGLRALRELNILSPLYEAGFNKRDVRLLARKLELPNWDKPARACLATRIPFGTPVTEEKLELLAAAERILEKEGLQDFRCRLHDTLVRIEICEQEFPALLEKRNEIIVQMKQLGVQYVTVDLTYKNG